MAPRGRGRAANRLRTTIKPIMDPKAHSINPNVRREQEEVLYDRVTQRLIDELSREIEMKYGIERSKALGTIKFRNGRARVSREVD